MATHSSTLARKIPRIDEPGRLQSMESLRVGHDWATSLSLFTFMHWRRQWQPTPVLLPGKLHGQRSLLGYSPWGRKESETTERLTFIFHFHALEKEMASHSSILAWRIPGPEEPGGLPSMGSHSVGHDWRDLAAAAAYKVWDSLISPKIWICFRNLLISFSLGLPAWRWHDCGGLIKNSFRVHLVSRISPFL